jgi:hypothetical protein
MNFTKGDIVIIPVPFTANLERFITKTPQHQIRGQNRFNQNVICYFVYLNSYICTNKHKNK